MFTGIALDGPLAGKVVSNDARSFRSTYDTVGRARATHTYHFFESLITVGQASISVWHEDTVAMSTLLLKLALRGVDKEHQEQVQNTFRILNAAGEATQVPVAIVRDNKLLREVVVTATQQARSDLDAFPDLIEEHGVCTEHMIRERRTYIVLPAGLRSFVVEFLYRRWGETAFVLGTGTIAPDDAEAQERLRRLSDTTKKRVKPEPPAPVSRRQIQI